MSRLYRRAPAALLVLFLLSSPAFAAPRPAPPRLIEQLSEAVVRAWYAIVSLLPSEKRGPGMDPNGLDVDPGTPPQSTAPAGGEQGPGMDPIG